LRAVAREAGVSPAAPYHHFKDKTELMEAVAKQGWRALSAAIANARAGAPTPRRSLGHIGLAYVKFARNNPALYRLMDDTTRDRTAMPKSHAAGDDGYAEVQRAMVEAGGAESSSVDLELATIALWCAAHGLAELACFKEFDTLKRELGGEDAFLVGVLNYIAVVSRHRQEAAREAAASPPVSLPLTGFESRLGAGAAQPEG
jgi:AcrR family transcriptional regulator